MQRIRASFSEGQRRLDPGYKPSPDRFVASVYARLTPAAFYKFKGSAVTEIEFLGNQSVDAQIIEAVASLPQITAVFFDGCIQIQDSWLEPLRSMPGLQLLSLRSCYSITDVACRYIAESSVRLLELEDCEKITDTGLKSLSTSKHLEVLGLPPFARITDEGLTHLADLRTLKSVSIGALRLVTYVGVERLSDAPSLEEMILTAMPQIPEAIRSRILQRHPSIKLIVPR